MTHRLILIEGIPGSGKTTLSARVAAGLEARGMRTRLYREGDSHPADMAWNAVLTPAEYDRTRTEHPHLAEALTLHTRIEDGRCIVAYTKLGREAMGAELNDYFAAHEVYDGRVSSELFAQLHRNRWASFARDALANPETVYVFECAYLQNHVNELMGFHDMSVAGMLSHLKALAEPVMPLQPLLVYLEQADPDETVRRVAAERVSPPGSGHPDWIDLVVDYVTNSPHGKALGYKGLAGALRFFRDRINLEQALWPDLPMDRIRIRNADYDWDAQYDAIMAAVLGQAASA